jgi:hypothetical protein
MQDAVVKVVDPDLHKLLAPDIVYDALLKGGANSPTLDWFRGKFESESAKVVSFSKVRKAVSM